MAMVLFSLFLLVILGQVSMVLETQPIPSEYPGAASPEKSAAKAHSSAGCKLSQESYQQISVGKAFDSAPLPNHLVMTNPFENHDLRPRLAAENLSPASEKFMYPQLQDLQERIEHAKYPRIGQAWARADNLSEDNKTTIARHDLYFSSAESFGLQWVKTEAGQSAEFEPCSVKLAKENRAELLAKNPNIVMLAEIRYHDAQDNLYPANSSVWKREGNAQVTNNEYPQFKKLDYSNPAVQDHVAAQARAALQSGAVDGVMLDWWRDGNEADAQAKMELLRKVRAAVGPDALIMINTNEYKMPEETTKLVNGFYMESSKTKDMHSDKDAHDEWKQIQDTLDYSEKNGRKPHINMVETWWEDGSASKRDELDKMRATTTLVMTHSDGYALFADPDRNGVTEDHRHDWYSFWDTDVGKPLAAGSISPDGSSRREFEHATVVSNATGDEAVVVKFAQDRKRASNGKTVKAGEQCIVGAHDGEIFLK
jgi:hypothetical protein